MKIPTTLLSDTIFRQVYAFFGAVNDDELIYSMGWYATAFTISIGVYSLFQPSPYGKFSTSWVGPKINAKFGWMIQESPAYLAPAILLYQSPCLFKQSLPNVLLTGLFITHYIQRSLIYPLRITTRAKPVPIATVVSAIGVCLFNGIFQCHHLLNVEKIEGSIFLTLGSFLFVTGMAINIYHDGILVALKTSQSTKGKSEYQIPRGGLFEYVSGANYLGEILEWWGFALASGKSPQLIFATFSNVFLGFRAWHNHQYYKQTFKASYPPERTALFPFVI